MGIPEYYEWRSRSGCFFCFFQRRDEWVGLAEKHPELFKRAMAMEEEVNRSFSDLSSRYTWVEGMSLKELIAKAGDIKKDSAYKKKRATDTRSWQEILMEDEQDDENQACMICSL